MNSDKKKLSQRLYYAKNKHKWVERWKNNKALMMGQRYKRQFNITLEDYNRLFESQAGKCSICGTHQTQLKESLSVDHCHLTNRVRGLLCGNCNRGIGLFRDDASRLQSAIRYLGVQ